MRDLSPETPGRELKLHGRLQGQTPSQDHPETSNDLKKVSLLDRIHSSPRNPASLLQRLQVKRRSPNLPIQQWDPKSTSLGRRLMEFPIQETQSRESSPERSSNNSITLSNDFGEESLRSIPLCSKCLPSSPSLEQLRQPSPSHSSSGLKQWTRYPDLTTRRLNEEFTLSGRVKEGDYKMMGCDMSKIPPFRPLMTVNSFRSQGNEDETMTNLVTLEETIPEMTAVCQEVTSGVSTRTSYPGTRSCWSRRLKES